MKSFTLENKHLKVVLLDYGALLHQLWVKDRNGDFVNVIQGLPSPEDYKKDSWSRGAVIGRFAGRLENPIQIDFEPIAIEHHEGVLLHSGSSGWGTKTWTCEKQHPNAVLFSITCPEGASGFPGTVNATMHYKIENTSLHLKYSAKTDRPTHINLTNHAYFNLNPKGKIKDQILHIQADEFLYLKNNLVPSGKRVNVSHTPFDFRTPKKINNTVLDDYFVLNSNAKIAASLSDPSSGIVMETLTDQPGVVVFTPPHFEAICFETQKFSNTPNIASFPSTLIRSNEVYQQNTEFRFSIKTES